MVHNEGILVVGADVQVVGPNLFVSVTSHCMFYWPVLLESYGVALYHVVLRYSD